MQSLCWYELNSPQGSAMNGRAPCGFLLSFGERGGIIGIWEMWEREWEHHGVERYGNERASCLLLNIH